MSSYYSGVSQILLAFFMAVVPVLTVKWLAANMSNRETRRVAYRDGIRDEIRCQEDNKRLSKHIDDLHIVLTHVIKRFHKNKIIDERDVELIEIEMEQRPDLKKYE